MICWQGGRSCAALAKSLDSDENFKPKLTLFCRELRFVGIYVLFGDLWAKKCLFGSNTAFLGQEVHYYIVYIAYFTEFNLQICDYAQKRRICRENRKCAFDENFHGHFCPRRKAAKFCHPAHIETTHFIKGLQLKSSPKALIQCTSDLRRNCECSWLPFIPRLE